MRICLAKGAVWDYSSLPPLNEKLLLLTKDNQVLVGAWRGGPPGENKTYKAWYGLPARCAETERLAVFK